MPASMKQELNNPLTAAPAASEDNYSYFDSLLTRTSNGPCSCMEFHGVWRGFPLLPVGYRDVLHQLAWISTSDNFSPKRKSLFSYKKVGKKSLKNLPKRVDKINL